MDRRGFLRRFGIGAAAVAAAPSIARAVVEPTEPTEVYSGPAYEKKFEPEDFKEVPEYFTNGHDVWSKAQMEADYMLTEAMNRELFLGSGQVTEQSLKGIFR